MRSSFPSGVLPLAKMPNNNPATASGSNNASPVKTVAAFFPTKPPTKSPNEIANSSSSLVNFGAVKSNTRLGEANVGTGVELPLDGNRIGPSISSGFGG